MKTRLTAWICAIAALAASVASAGWSTNAWPSQDWPRAGYLHAAECYSAAVERATLAGVSTSLWPRVDWDGSGGGFTGGYQIVFWRNQGGEVFPGPHSRTGNLAAVKEFVRDYIVTNFIDRSPTNAFGVFSNLSEVAYYSITGICVHAGVPTNFFDYTPQRGLNGVGPWTNDATVPYPHGWTNESTASGGTDFPASRTNWYTTDYGWAGLHDILNLCAWTMRDPDTYQGERWRSRDPWNQSAACATALAAQEASWGSLKASGTGSYQYRVFAFWCNDLTVGDYSAYADHRVGAPIVSNVQSKADLGCAIDIYLYPTMLADYLGEWEFPPEETPYIQFADLDGIGIGSVSNWYYWTTMAEGTNTTRGGTNELPVLGIVSNNPVTLAGVTCPDGGPWSVQPWPTYGPPEDGARIVHAGFNATCKLVLKWDGTNGLDYIAD